VEMHQGITTADTMGPGESYNGAIEVPGCSLRPDRHDKKNGRDPLTSD
jgi:hypothetical protein